VTLIAVVDDDESLRESLQDLLRSMGYGVEVFTSGEELLRADCLARTDCLVLDINMPGMSGLEVQDELVYRGHAIPIVFITAYGKDACARSSEREPTNCLLKPFDEEALSAALGRALGRRRIA
jgi:FixJ family two-component response regulator